MEISLLRTLVEQQQFLPLKQQAELLWQQTTDADVLPLLALACTRLGELNTAQTWLDLALESQAQLSTDGLVDLAAVWLLKKDAVKAQALLQPVLAEQPDAASEKSLYGYSLALARLGFAYQLQQEFTLAEQALTHSLELAPQRISAQANLVGLYLQQQQWDKAAAQLREAAAQLEQQVSLLPETTVQGFYALLRELQLTLWIKTECFAEAEQWLAEQQTELTDEAFVVLVQVAVRLLAEADRHEQATELLREYGKQYPQFSALKLQMVELAQLQGRTLQALKLINASLNDEPKNIALWVQLSATALRHNEAQAREAAEKAVALCQALAAEGDSDFGLEVSEQQLADLTLKATHALAMVESQAQQFDAAEPLFLQCLASNEFFVPALSGLGQQYMQQGRIDEAVALFEKVSEIDPIKGHSSLINARKFPDDPAVLEKMERAAKQPSLEGSMRSSILFQLAAAWEKRKQYDRAFALANEANAASKKFLPYDGKAHRNRCARIRARFSSALYQHRPDSGIDSQVPVFVIGMPRSGTTLVEQVLASHSEIFGAGELGLVPQLIQGLERWERHTGSGRHYPDCVDDITVPVSKQLAQQLLDELQSYAPEAKHVVDKLPHNFENVGLIKLLFPNAKIISVRRDPRDIAISNYFTDYQAKYGGMGFAYDLTDIGEQLADHNLLMHHWQQVFGDDILEIHYEDVVEDLEGSARKMLAYIGVDWQEQVLGFNKLDRTVKTASVWQVRQPIYKSSKAKWMRYQNHLAPLIKGTNAKIEPDPIEDMITLPVAGFLTDGVAHFKDNQLDEAELSFKKMLHHNPKHAACQYMVGLVYLRKNHMQEGIEFIEKALATCPWQKEWRDNLIKAYQVTGQSDKAEKLQQKGGRAEPEQAETAQTAEFDLDALRELEY